MRIIQITGDDASPRMVTFGNTMVVAAAGTSSRPCRRNKSRPSRLNKARRLIGPKRKDQSSCRPNSSRCAFRQAPFPPPMFMATGSQLSSVSIRTSGPIPHVAPLFRNCVLARNRRSDEPRGSSLSDIGPGRCAATDGESRPMATLCCPTMTAPPGICISRRTTPRPSPQAPQIRA
jgi:hypothetical protein